MKDFNIKKTYISLSTSIIINHIFIITAMDAFGSRLTHDISYLEPMSRHKNVMSLYDL